jgi:hypothetical protein
MALKDRPDPKWLEALSRHQQQTANVLLVGAGLFAAAAVFLGVQYRWEGWIEAAACGLFAVVLATGGFWSKSREPGAMSDLDATRMLVLSVGGLLGFFIALLAFGRAIRWINYFTGGLETWQGEGAWRIWVCIVAELVGLAIMFLSLQLARTEERSNVVLRRVLYGYNAVLSGLLVLALLVVLNIMAYVYLPAVSDWTASGMYSLSSQSKNFLENLKQPVRIYVFSTRGIPDDVRNFMDNCQAATKNLTVEYLSLTRDPERIRELIQRYQILGEEGMLVVYGNPPDESQQFIKFEGELFDRDQSDPRAARYVFKGEDAVITAIDYLMSGKSRAVVYFTQGNGELDIDDFSATKQDKGAGLLVERLQKSNYEVKGIKFSPVAAKGEKGKTIVVPRVPDDASAVIIAGPRSPFPPDALDALRDYMDPKDAKKKKGKLVVLLDVVEQGGKMVQTGLEKLLLDYGVEVGNNRIMTIARRKILQSSGGVLKMTAEAPTFIRASPNPALVDRNPIAKAFEDLALPMLDARTVRPQTGANPARSSYQAEVLLQTTDSGIWAEDNLSSEPTQLVSDYLNNRPRDLDEKLSREPLPVAVVVTESGPPDPSDPHAGFRGRPMGPQKPRLVVFGDATMASNVVMQSGRTEIYSLFSSSLAWLRERPGNIGIEAKKRNIFVLDAKTNVSRMIWLPAALMAFGIIQLGLGVWVVRRR